MAEIKIGRIALGSYQTNCYFVYREDEKKALVFDPGDSGKQLYDKLTANGFTVEAILLTHAHFDHIWGVKALSEASGAKVYAWENERLLCEKAKVNLSDWAGRPCTVDTDVYLKDGEEITLAGIDLKVIGTPGHTQGSCCYYIEEAGFLLGGDTLFLESVGRSDFPTGSMSELVRSIREKLYVLPGETKVYPGHGDSTTIAHEEKYNPFTA